jgi:hypothetical protein
MAGGFKVYRKLDPIQGRGPRLTVGALEKQDTDRGIRHAVGYCKSDNYIAASFGVEERRVARIRDEEESKPDRSYYDFNGMRMDGVGSNTLTAQRQAIALSTAALHKAVMTLYQRHARKDGVSLHQAAFAMGMRP